MQGSGSPINEELIKSKLYPMIMHNGTKILSDMPKFIFYLYDKFHIEMNLHKMWPAIRQEEIVYYLEWYSYKLRPFMWEFYGVMTATHQAGLRNTSAFGGIDFNNEDDDNHVYLQENKST